VEANVGRKSIMAGLRLHGVVLNEAVNTSSWHGT